MVNPNHNAKIDILITKYYFRNRESAVDVEQKADFTNLNQEDYEGWDDTIDLSAEFVCDNVDRTKRVSQRGLFYVIYNFVRAEQEFGCTDSITLSAPGDFR